MKGLHNGRKGVRSLLSRSNRGFTLVEVLVSMVLTLTFVMVTMQIFLSAAFLRAKAMEYNDAYNWIQEDFETVLRQARSFEMQAYPYSSHCATGTLASNFTATGLGGSTTNLGQRSFGGTTFELVRTASNKNTQDPTRLLNVNYVITPVGQAKPALEINTRVVVYAAFNCPTS